MKRIITIAFVLAIATSARAQQDPEYSQYMFNQLFINPAYAGTHELANVTLLSRKQWWGFEGSPFTTFLSADTPLKLINSGIGLTAVHDRLGVTRKTSLYGSYSYMFPLAGGKLSFGLRAGATNYSAEVTDVSVIEAGDAAYGSNISVVTPNFGTGAYYFTDRLYLGVAVPHLLSYEEGTALDATGIQDQYQMVRHYYLYGGYAFVISENLMLRPSALIKYVGEAPAQADINLNALISNVVWVGASYRTIQTAIVMAGVQITPRFMVGYSFDFPTTKVSRGTYGSHEIILSYDFGKQKEKIKTPRYF